LWLNLSLTKLLTSTYYILVIYSTTQKSNYVNRQKLSIHICEIQVIMAVPYHGLPQ